VTRGATMHLRLKTKITLIMAFLVLAVVGVNSTLYVATLTRQVIRQANETRPIGFASCLFPGPKRSVRIGQGRGNTRVERT